MSKCMFYLFKVTVVQEFPLLTKVLKPSSFKVFKVLVTRNYDLETIMCKHSYTQELVNICTKFFLI